MTQEASDLTHCQWSGKGKEKAYMFLYYSFRTSLVSNYKKLPMKVTHVSIPSEEIGGKDIIKSLLQKGLKRTVITNVLLQG